MNLPCFFWYLVLSKRKKKIIKFCPDFMGPLFYALFSLIIVTGETDPVSFPIYCMIWGRSDKRNEGGWGGCWLGTVIGHIFLHAMSPFASDMRTKESTVLQIAVNYSSNIFRASFCSHILKCLPLAAINVSPFVDYQGVNLKSLL